MSERRTLLVGSIPASSAEEAMTTALTTVGPFLRYLPDGETGERDRWVVSIIDGLRSHPDLRLRRDGRFTDYADGPRFSVRTGHRLTGDGLDLGHLAAYRENRPTFDRLRAEFEHPDLAFQVGLPSDFDLALFGFGPAGLFRYRRAFADALADEIDRIHTDAGDEVLFQIEVPAELVFVAKAPAPLRSRVAAWASRAVVGLARRAPTGTRFGVHLCLGDLGHQALANPRDTAAVVALGNAITRTWPPDRRLEYLHAPLAAGSQPAPLDPEFYRGLARISLPDSTRFVAGFLHEDRTLDEHRRILDHVESSVGRPVDIAAACGLSRRGAEAAAVVLRHSAELCAQP